MNRKIMVFVLAMLASGCEPGDDWTFDIIGKDKDGPIFCFTQKSSFWQKTPEHCKYHGGNLYRIDVDEYDASIRHVVRHAWSIVDVGGGGKSFLGVLRYGSIPEGWNEKLPPQPIKNDTYYNIEYYYFRCDANKCQVWHGMRDLPQ